jgi:hypothetical protein
MPIDLELVLLPGAQPCAEGRGTKILTSTPDVEYQVLQEARTIKIPVQQCCLCRLVLPFYCEHYDHQVVVTHDMEVDRPVNLSREDCENMWQWLELVVKSLKIQ